MKRLRLFVATVIIAAATACNFTEEVYLNDDGSGKLSINFDANELMAMAGSLDSLKQEKAMDSTIVFKDLLEEKKDSIAQLPSEEQAKLKKLEAFSMHIVMKPEEQKMQFEMFSEFKNVNEVNDAFNAFQNVSALGPSPMGGNQAPPMPVQDPTTQVNYTFSGNQFSRSTTIINQELFQKSLDSLAGAEMFLSSSTYTFKYHFPRRVKNVNVEGATFSMDGKTMIYEVSFLDMMKMPESINLEVELED
ncbi:hypothetical protein [Croceitalea rosinachiae]|uniref:Lipoprotein n=1 Tax=Croceitalea rosinachiae TaxID=3075596 RepID=A0ABU3AAH2_9FLAO|nr:hypothetical protein [Croceitalea sp. F388]MDT0606888.1 hypothetical protein [Croceitalea sp. F388]